MASNIDDTSLLMGMLSEDGISLDDERLLATVYRSDESVPKSSHKCHPDPAAMRSAKTVNVKRYRGPDKKPRKRRVAKASSSIPSHLELSEVESSTEHIPSEPCDEVSDVVTATSDVDELSTCTTSDDEEDEHISPPISRHARRVEAIQAEWCKVRQELVSSYLIGRAIQPSQVCIPPSLTNICPDCDKNEEAATTCMCSKMICVKIVTLEGVNAKDLELRWCMHSREPTPIDCLHHGLFPFSPTTFTMFIQFTLLRFLSCLMDHSPTSSASVMASVLSLLGKDSVRRDALICIVNQWRALEFEEKRLVFDELFVCPACPGGGHCVHIDGNFKLYRYAAQGRAQEDQPGIESSFVGSDEAVEKLMHELNYLTTSEVDNVCGGRWRAARNQPGRKSGKIDETGLEIASCRHDVALKAINMHRGEIFPYPLFLQLQFPTAKFMAMDVVCKYYPWLQKTSYKDVATAQRPLLSELHSKAHSWVCQMSWSARKQEGAGLTTGESTEHVNSYLSRHGVTTRQMTKSNRIVRLTQAAAHWNVMKIYKLPEQLLRMSKKAKAILADAPKDMHEMERRARHINLITETTDPLKVDVEVNAANCQRLYQHITRIGDSSKMRARLKIKLSKAENKLQNAIRQLMAAHPELDGGQVHLGCRSGIFPWMKFVDADITFEEALYAYDQVHLVKRATEELELLKVEHSNAIDYHVPQLNQQDCHKRMR